MICRVDNRTVAVPRIAPKRLGARLAFLRRASFFTRKTRPSGAASNLEMGNRPDVEMFQDLRPPTLSSGSVWKRQIRGVSRAAHRG
jgi:hypothetical protein